MTGALWAALALSLAGVECRLAASATSRGHRPQLLRAVRTLRGGADDQQLFVVRKRDDANGTALPLMVRSLGAFCDEHDLDEESMLAVSRGEAEEHDGWVCEQASEYDAPIEVVSVEDVDAAAADEVDESGTEEDEAAPTTPQPAMPPIQTNKMILGFVAPLAATQVLKRFDQKSPYYMIGLRSFFFGVIAFNVLVQFVLQWRIAAAKDATIMPAAPANPLAMLFGGGGAPAKSKTVSEYDREQLKSLRTSYQFSCLLNLFLHFQMKLTQPMVYASVSGLVDLFYNPLVQIHLLRHKAEGPYKRPFGSGGPGLGALFNATAAVGGGPGAAGGDGGEDDVLGGTVPR